MRTTERWSSDWSSRLAILLLVAACGCGAHLTPQQEWVLGMFAECKTRTNALNVVLERVSPDGTWYARVAQTQSEYNRLVACMNDDAVWVALQRREADAGNARAMANLGFMYESGRGGLTKDDAEAVRWYRKGAEAGDPGAMNNLGAMYAAGRGGLAQDGAEAVRWYRRGADAGNGRAMTNLGILYESGRGGLAKDDVEAARWYRKGADAGDAFAM